MACTSCRARGRGLEWLRGKRCLVDSGTLWLGGKRCLVYQKDGMSLRNGLEREKRIMCLRNGLVDRKDGMGLRDGPA